VNDLLRSHVTSTAFALTLGKTQVAALVQLDRMLQEDRHFHPLGPRNVFSAFVPGIRGLLDRGLATHTMPKGKRTDLVPVGKIWSITKAGQLVIELLKEAGIYQEYSGELTMRQTMRDQQNEENEERRWAKTEEKQR